MKAVATLIALILLLAVMAPANGAQQQQAPPPPATSAGVPEVRAQQKSGPTPATHAAVAQRAKELSSSDPVKVAAAAYWLGEQGIAAGEAIPQLAAVLGDNRQVNPAHYRRHSGHVSLGEPSSPGREAAAALAKIGEPAVETLINILKTSPNAVARQNAAWALGIIQDRHTTALFAGGQITSTTEANR